MKKILLWTVLVMMMMPTMVMFSCSDDDKQEIESVKKPYDEMIIGFWSCVADGETMNFVFFDNGTYAETGDNDWYYDGKYQVIGDSVKFTTLWPEERVNSIRIISLSDDTFVFDGYGSKTFRGTKEKNVNHETVAEHRQQIVGDWDITYDLYGKETSPMSIKSNGTFDFENGEYTGPYSICDNKILFLDATWKCPVGGLLTIKDMSEKQFVLVNTDGEQIVGTKKQ